MKILGCTETSTSLREGVKYTAFMQCLRAKNLQVNMLQAIGFKLIERITNAKITKSSSLTLNLPMEQVEQQGC
jgi:hypothetical protein